ELCFEASPVAPRCINKGRLRPAEVPPPAVASPGTHSVMASNSDGMTTPTQTLTVVQPDPDTIIRLDVNASEEGSPLRAPLELHGSEFSDSTKVFVWGRSQAKVVDGSSIQFVIPNNLLQDAARIPVYVRDKKGNFSNTEIYFVVPRPPQIDFLDPDTVEVGTEDVPLSVHGQFKPGAQVVVNDLELLTTEGKNGRLEVMLPAALIAQPAQLKIRVAQEGVQSNDVTLAVTPTEGPFIYTIAPTLIRIGEGRLSIDVIGANFKEGSTATVDGMDARIKNRTRKRLSVVVPPAILDQLGTHTVQVFDDTGAATDPSTFLIVPDVQVSTLAGKDKPGFSADCVNSDDSFLRRPRRLAFGPDGLIYFTDQQNHAVRTLNPTTGEVCTVVGVSGNEGYLDTGNALGRPEAFSFPNGVAVDPNGTIYISENGNGVIRRVTRAGGTLTVDTFAGTFRLITEKEKQKGRNADKEGIVGFRDSTLLDSSFRLPDDMVIAPDGTIFIADAENHAIRRIVDRGGQKVVETVAGNGVPGFADGVGVNARFNTPTAIALSLDSTALIVADTNNGRVRHIDLTTGAVTTLAGSGKIEVIDGPPAEAGFIQPIGIAVDTNGIIYISELGAADIRRIDRFGNVSTLAGGTNAKFRDGPGVDAKFDGPRGLLIDRDHAILYVADYGNLRIRKVALNK